MENVWGLTLDYLAKKISEREWVWIADSHMKYMHIKIDSRDGMCILMDRDKNVVARTPEELDTLFDKISTKTKQMGFDRASQDKFYGGV